MSATIANPTAIEDRRIDAGGIDTHYLEAGSGDPLLLLHGSGPGVSAQSNWRHTIPYFAEHYRVLAPEYVGFGTTERPTDVIYGIRTWVDHMVAFLDAAEIDRVRVVGNSMGGAIALWLARYHPDRVDRIVLMGSGGVARKNDQEGHRNLRAYEPTLENMRALIKRAFLYDESLYDEQMAIDRFEASRQPGVQEAYEAMFHDPRHHGNDHQLDSEDIRQITTEALVIHGREDRIIPVSVAYTLFDLLPNVTLHLFSRCGHWAQIERKDEFNPLVLDFLTRDQI